MIDSSRPYPGLRPFQREESDIFFGRNKQIDELLDRLDRQHFVAVTGPSGCGKSSLVQAGLIAGLESGLMLKAGARWRVAGLRPGNNPLRSLADRLLDATALGSERAADPNAAEHLLATLRRGPLGLVEALRQTPLPERTNLLVLVDQFEELFRYQEGQAAMQTTPSRRQHPSDEADAFVALLLATAAEQSTPIYIVITMRSDYLGHCSMFTGLPEAINESQYLTPRLTRDQCREAIVGPARVFGGDVEAALVNRMLNDMGPDPDQLPLMQHALMRMWTLASPESKDDESGVARCLTLDQYEKLGGLGQALSEHADQAFGELDEEGQRIAEVLFKSLTERSPDHPDARRPTTVEAASTIAGVPWPDTVRVADAFRRSDRSFLTPSGSQALKSSDTLDISHESLIRQWLKLSEWVETEAYSSWRFRRLKEQAGLWKRKEGGLWEELDLERDLAWRQKEKPTPEWAERYGGGFALAMEFLDASEQASEAKKKAETVEKQKVLRTRSELRLTRAVVVLALLAVLAVGVAAFSLFFGEQESRRRLTIAGLDKSSNVLDGERPADALTSLAAILRETDYDWRASSYLTNTLLQTSWALPVFVVKTEQSPSSVSVSGDGRRVLAVVDGAVHLWDASKRDAWQLMADRLGTNRVSSAVFSTDGQQVLTIGVGASAELWNAKDRQVAFRLEHKSDVYFGAFSSDGRRVVTTTADGMAWIWEVATGLPLQSVTARSDSASQSSLSDNQPSGAAGAMPRGPLVSAALSTDGTRVVTATEDGTAQIWDVDTGRPSRDAQSLPGGGQPGRVLSVAFIQEEGLNVRERSRTPARPDTGGTVVAAFADSGIGIFEPPQRSPAPGVPSTDGTSRLEPSGGTLHAASVSLNGRLVVRVSADSAVRVSHLLSGRLTSAPLRHCSQPGAAAVSEDGRWVVTSCGNKVWMWDVTSGRAVSPLLRPSARVIAGNFSADGQRVVTASTDGTAQVWDLNGQPIGGPLRHEGEIYSAAFNPTNSLVVTASTDATVRFWSVGESNPIAGPLIQDPEIRAITFRSEQLVAARANGTLRVWAAKTSEPIGDPVQLGGPVRSAAFSLDGKLVVTVSANGKTTRAWNTLDGRPIGPPIQHDVEVGSAAISPQGGRVITTSSNGQAIVWHVASASIIDRLNGIGPAAFSPDGRQVMIVTEPTALGFSYVVPERPEDVSLFQRIWSVVKPAPKNVTQLKHLADLAEAVSGFAEDHGTKVPVDDPVRALGELRRQVDKAVQGDEIAWLIRWFLADRCQRNISPLSNTGVGAHLQRPAEVGEDPALRFSCSAGR